MTGKTMSPHTWCEDGMTEIDSAELQRKWVNKKGAEEICALRTCDNF